MIKEVFADDEITKAFAAFGPVIGLSAVAAPVIGGALTDGDLLGLGWRSIFLVNVPLGIAGLIGAVRLMPRTGGNPGTRLDPGGALLAMLASFAIVYPLVQGRGSTGRSGSSCSSRRAPRAAECSRSTSAATRTAPWSRRACCETARSPAGCSSRSASSRR